MAVGRYVAVSSDTTDKAIKDGPLLWDPKDEYNPGPGLVLMLESEALANGYEYPPPPAEV